MSDPSIHRDLGRIDATLVSQAAQIKAMQTAQADTDAKITAIHNVVMQAKGGWKTLVVVGTLSSAFTTAAIKAWAWLKSVGG